MAEINWGLGVMPDVGMNAFRAFKAGQEEGRARRAENALAAYAQNPDQNTLGDAISANPDQALQIRQYETERQNAAQAQHQQQLAMMGRLLTYAAQGPQQWQQAHAKAQEFGIDVSEVPPQYDPEWAKQQIGIINAISSPQGQQALSIAGKLATDEGFRPGTPEFAARVTQIWQTESTKFYPLTQGGGLAGVAPGQSAQLVIAPNPGGYQAGAPVGSAPSGDLPRVTSPEEAMRLPPGSKFMMPDGRIGTVPGGPTPSASGNFPVAN